MAFTLRGGTIILPTGLVQSDLSFDKTFKRIDTSASELMDGTESLDVSGLYVAPGFIDVHIHGSNGSDVMDGTVESLENISKTIIKTGTTRFLPTTMTQSSERIHTSLNAIKTYMGHEAGAKILGVHLEGPFISKNAYGAQNPVYIQNPNWELIQSHRDLIKIITYAPEHDEAFQFTKALAANHIIPSIGHTCCSYDVACGAIMHGAKGFTHLFNAMTGLHHRNPGAVGAAFTTDAYVELIADGIHVHPHLFSVVEKIKSAERMLLVTDAMRAACLKEGTFDLGGQDVTVKDGVASLADGTLAGSVLNQMMAVKNMTTNTVLDLSNIIKMVTLTPATYLGVSDELGSIEPGKIADVVVFDANFDVHYVFCEGICMFRRDHESD